MFWFIATFVVSLVVAYASVPSPQNQPPFSLGDLKAPTAEDGREIPVLFGTRTISGPNVVYYGDLKITPVKVKGGKK